MDWRESGRVKIIESITTLLSSNLNSPCLMGWKNRLSYLGNRKTFWIVNYFSQNVSNWIRFLEKVLKVGAMPNSYHLDTIF